MRRSYKNIPINTSKNTHEVVFGLVPLDKKAIIGDIPCGSGAFILRLKDQGYSQIKAIDIENILDVDCDSFVQGDMTKTLPFPDGALDCMVCIDGIEHISSQFDFVKEINRVLSKDGSLIISTPNISSIRSRWRWLTTGHHHKCNSPLNENKPSFLHHIGMISFPEIRYLLHTNGFVLDKVTTNRIKPVSWLFLILVPFIFLSTYLTYRKYGRKLGTKGMNKEIFNTMFSRAILFGETMIIRAVKIEESKE